jgi:hypothetical protein
MSANGIFLCVAGVGDGVSPWRRDRHGKHGGRQKWVDEEFQPSTLSKEEQMKEMEWFIKAAKPFKGMNIKVVSETIPTHEYEAKVLAKALRRSPASRSLST